MNAYFCGDCRVNISCTVKIAPEDFDENGVDKNQRRIVLVGKTGAGKSATANTILGGKYFESKASGQSVTYVCSKKEASRFGKKVFVVDTPGIFDTKMDNDELNEELVKCILTSTPGPHAFVIVISVVRNTDEENKTIEQFLKLFSEKVLEYSVVVFTGRDTLEGDGTDIVHYVETLSQPIKRILQKCGNRYIAFNNKTGKCSKDNDVKRLLEIVEQIVEDNGGSYYSSDMYKDAERALQEQMEKAKEEEKRKRDEEIKAIESRIKQEEELKRQVKRINELYEKNTDPKNLRAEALEKAAKKRGPLGHLGHGVLSLGTFIASPFKAFASLFGE